MQKRTSQLVNIDFSKEPKRIYQNFLKNLWFLVLVISVFSCTTNQQGQLITSPKPRVSVTPTDKIRSPTKTSQPIVTDIYVPSISPTESFDTNTPIPTGQTNLSCQEIIDTQFPNDFSAEGAIVFEGECEERHGLYKLNTTDHRIESFLDNPLEDQISRWFTAVSQDHQWLAIGETYWQNGVVPLERFIVVTGEDENSAIVYPIQQNWGLPREWMSYQLLSIPLWRAPYVSQDLLNPFTGSVFRFTYEYNWLERGEIFFDPPVARVLYFDDFESNCYILKEIDTDKVLWQSEDDNWHKLFAYQPQWAPNGNYFAFPIWNDDEKSEFRFVAVSRDGNELSTQTFQNLNSSYIPFDWSSSGKYLSFWKEIENDAQQLMIWNPEKNEIIDLNLTTTYHPGWPIFSPNEDDFILSIGDSSSTDENGSNYLVNISSRQIIQLHLDLDPIAWLKPIDQMRLTVPSEEEMFSPAPIIGSTVVQKCMKYQDSEEKTPQYTGSIIYFRENSLFSISVENGPSKLSDAKFIPATTAFVSPDREWLFYWFYDNNFETHYWLYPANGQQTEIQNAIGIVSSGLGSDDDPVQGWFNNQELWVYARSYGYGLFNPFENTFREPPEFADPEIAGCIDWDYCSGLARTDIEFYDPVFSRVTFLASPSSIIMMDRDATFLWQFSHLLIPFNIPRWSPNGQVMGAPLPKDILGEHYEFFIIDLDGNSKQITDYASEYPTFKIDKFQWSPDGGHIAFWADIHSQEGIAQRNPYRLFVLDTETHKTTDYCVVGNYSNNIAPIWSPNGKQIVINSIRDEKWVIFLVDIENGLISQLTEGNLVGWMK